MLVDSPFLRSVRAASSTDVERVLVINGHPDPRPERFCAALCAAFELGAGDAGRGVRKLNVGEESLGGNFDAGLERLWWSDVVFVAYPIWLGRPPPALCRLFEIFANQTGRVDMASGRMLAHFFITASLPSLLYRPRDTNGGRSSVLPNLRGMEIGSATILGSIEISSKRDRKQWLTDVRRLGSTGSWDSRP
jgi:putative NADPH-quinone reductase